LKEVDRSEFIDKSKFPKIWCRSEKAWWC